MGATNTEGRLLASLFRAGPVDPVFCDCLDVPNGGVLLGLPAVLSMGLLRHTDKYFQLPNGYYRLDSIFLLLAFMALARLKTIESLRYRAPGEWGKLLGLDRVPEARTLRNKVHLLTEDGQAAQWGGELSRDWMEMFPESAGVLYVDGHVRVYNGSRTELPRHYVARQKLCLRATTDYWVNAMDGQPFFMVNKAVDPGLLTVLEEEIVPRLEQEVPYQPSLFALTEERFLPRFTLVFDREGYSPDFALRMWARRIACLTYHKYPGDDWPESEFHKQKVTLVSGHVVAMKLAERGTLLGGKLWVREIRKLTESGHQTAIISTGYIRDLITSAALMFARWSQENFFKYMREHYNLDRLVDYSVEDIPGTTRVVNPLYREADGDVRKQAAQLARKRCEYDGIVLCDDIEPDKVEEYETNKQVLREEVESMKQTLEELKACRKATPKHVMFSDLPEEDRFKKLVMKSKYFIDTIKLVAYRAETAMVNIARQSMSREEEARSLLRSLYTTEADILPDYEENKLIIRLHQPANRCSAVTIKNLCVELNTTNTKFPGTDLRLVYEMVS
jgi:prepilin-type processing-associated H-X9-DG protein